MNWLKWFLTIVAILILASISYFFYQKISDIDNSSSEFLNELKEDNDAEISPATIKTDINGIPEGFYEAVRDQEQVEKELDNLDRSLNKELKEKDKVEILRYKAQILFTQRKDYEKIAQAIKDWKKLYKIASDNTNKGDALYRSASSYWRSGGDNRIADEIFKDDFNVFLAEDKTVGRSLINVFNESYNLYPQAKTALSLAYWYAELGDLNESKKWFNIWNVFENKYPRLQEVIVMEKLNYLQEDIESNYEYLINNLGNDRNGGTFINSFHAVYLSSLEDKNTEKIKNLLDKIMKFIINDPKPEYNEYVYFLNVQGKKPKNKRDLLASGLVKLSKEYPEFRKFLNNYGFNLK